MGKLTFTLFRLAAIVLVVLCLSRCGKGSNVRWVYYDETNCSDKWAFTNNNEVLKNNVIDYMDSKGIKIFEIEIFRIVEAESCSECACKTGRQIKCKIKKGDVDKAASEGFYQ